MPAVWADDSAEHKPDYRRSGRGGKTFTARRIKDALTALWEASDRVRGKRLVAMIPILLPALEQHGPVAAQQRREDDGD